MFAKLLHIANGQLRALLTKGLHGAQAIWDWYRELGRGNESEARGLGLLREWSQSNSRSMTRIDTFTSLAAIAVSGIGYALAPERTSMSLTTPAAQ
jgi:hypothetical protein